MKQLLLSTALVVALATTSEAATFNAYILADDCSNMNPASAGAQVCMSFLMGSFETLMAVQAVTEHFAKVSNSGPSKPLVCTSVAPTASDMQEVFNIYVKQNPPSADMPAGLAAIGAFVAAYPCK